MTTHKVWQYLDCCFKSLIAATMWRKYKIYIMARLHIVFSCLIHIIFATLLFVDLSSVKLDPPSNIAKNAVIVDLVPITEVTNIKIAKTKGKKSASEDKEIVKPTPTKKKAVIKSAEGVPVKDPVRVVKRKPLESESIRKKGSAPNKLQSALKAVKQIDETVHINPDEKAEDGVLGKGLAQMNTLKPQTINMIESIRSQFIHCWSVPYGALQAKNMQVKVNISLDKEGAVLDANIMDMGRYGSDPFFRAIADSAVRAIYKCSPLQGLPKEKYNLWQIIELVFNPRDMLSA